MRPLRRMFGRGPRPPSPHRAPSPANTPPAVAAQPPPSADLQARLWNQAYDGLRADEPEIVTAYKDLLLKELPTANEIEQTEPEWRQMERLVSAGLQKTARGAAVKQQIGDGFQTVSIVRGLVEKAVQTAPEAAIAWVGVSFALEVLSNPFTEPRVNREGLSYVVSRMNWYWNLVDVLLDGRAGPAFHGLRDQLETCIVQLYQKLLLYQMKSICLYHRSRVAVFFRDVALLDDWGGQIKDIKQAETAVWRDSKQYSSEQVRSRLEVIAGAAERQFSELQGITSAIHNQTRRQEQVYQNEKDEKCLQDLHDTDPIHDKTRIQDTKGGLLPDSYRWILDNPDFMRWRTDPLGLFWIRGDPGKGKTMLLCGIIDELEKDRKNKLSYFFCQATEQKLNNAPAVLRGLVYALVRRLPSLISHVREEYDGGGKQRFEGLNAWQVMSKILTSILSDPILDGVILIVDALDECGAGRPQLLDFIIRISASSSTKWIVSSRNWPEIEEKLAATSQVTLRLELNEDSISDAVRVYIRYKVGELARLKCYDDATRLAVHHHFDENSNNTFLWVALAYQELATPDVQSWEAADILKTLPPGLESLYERMMEQIGRSRHAERCREILAVASVVYRPISLKELTSIAAPLARFTDNLLPLERLVGSCGSFLTLREGILYFVHQSARDFLLDKASHEILPYGINHQHRVIFSRSVEVMSRTLRRDIYDLVAPGFSIDDIDPYDPGPLAPVRYMCMHWIDHLQDADPAEKLTGEYLQDDGLVHIFLQRRYLYWLEAMSLQRSMPQAVLAVQKLQNLVAAAGVQQLADLVHDALRFVLSHKGAIETAPLQLYASALVFSPTRSIVKNLFKHDEPNWVLSPSLIQRDWDACVQTLECPAITSVAVAADGTRLASGSSLGNVKIWDAATGQCMQTLIDHGHKDYYQAASVHSVAFTADGMRLASGLGWLSALGSKSGTIQIWDISTGQCMQELEGHSDRVNSVAFTADGIQLASGSHDHTIKIWNTTTGQCVRTLEDHSDSVNSVAFAADGILASGSSDCTIKIWDLARDECVHTLECPNDKDYHIARVRSVAFTVDGKWLASGSDDYTIKIWDVATAQCTQTLEGHHSHVGSVAFLTDSTWLVSGSYDRTIKIWDATTGQCVQTIQGHGRPVSSVAFLINSTWPTLGSTWRLISGSFDGTIKIWDVAISYDVQKLDGHSGWIKSLAFAADGTRLASGSHHDHIIRIWNTATGQCVQTLEGHSDSVNSVAFAADGMRLASGSHDHTIKIWDTATGKPVQTLKDHKDSVRVVAFTADSSRLASGSSNIKIWDAATGIYTYMRTLVGHALPVDSLAFTADGTRLASGSYDHTVKIWDLATGHCLQTLIGHSYIVSSVAFIADGMRLASGSRNIKIWDAATGACIQTIDVGSAVQHLSFDPHTKSNLSSEFGTLALDLSGSHTKQQEASPTLPAYHGCGISPGGVWIVKDARRLLWLPSEYRPWITAKMGSCIALGCSSGRVVILHLFDGGAEYNTLRQ